MFTRVCTLVGMGALLLFAYGCEKKEDVDRSGDPTREVVITDTEVGTGPEVKEDDLVWVLYRGTFEKKDDEGNVTTEAFDTNMDDLTSQVPLMFVAGPKGGVIKGWQTGILGAKAGGTRQLNVPWELAYGPDGDGSKIPPKQDLDFEIKVLYVWREALKDVYDIEKDEPGSGAEVKNGDTVTIHYRGTYLTGKRWDDTKERGEPVSFKIGEKKAMLGLEYGLLGMKPGGKRTIVIPHTLALGIGGSQFVQGMQPLRIEIELLKVNG